MERVMNLIPEKAYNLIFVALLILSFYQKNLTAENRNSNRILEFAEKGNLVMIQKIVRQGVKTNSINKSGDTPLLIAAKNGHLHVVKYLFKKESKIYHVNNYRYDVMDMAVSNNHADIVRFLLENGFNAHRRKDQGCYYLCQAVRNVNFEIAKLLIEKGKTALQTRDPRHRLFNSAVNVALDIEKPDMAKMVRYLITEGAAVDGFFTGLKGRSYTPLTRSVYKNFNDIAKLLLENGANPVEACESGEKPIDVALLNNNFEALSMLVEKGVKIDTISIKGQPALHQASHSGNYDLVRFFLSYGLSPDNQHDIHKDTPLMRACQTGYLTIVELFIKNDAHVNIKNQFGETALILAAENGHTDVVEFLLESGADINQQDSSGNTALIKAVSHNWILTVQKLIDSAVNLTLKNDEGENALDIAISKGNTHIINLLKNAMAGNSSDFIYF